MNYRKMFSVKIGFLIVLGALFSSTVAAQSTPADLASARIPAEGRTVIMGTWMWDVETNSQGPNRLNDVWWQQVDEVTQFLVPVNGASIAVVRRADLDSKGADAFGDLTFRRRAVENIDLEPGSVLVIRTAEGNFARLSVVGYRALHDMSFADLQFARQSWLDYLLTKPDRPNYHLEVDWALYPNISPK